MHPFRASQDCAELGCSVSWAKLRVPKQALVYVQSKGSVVSCVPSAHLTAVHMITIGAAQVITPPEFANMQPYVSIDQLNALASTTLQVSLLHVEVLCGTPCCLRVQGQHSLPAASTGRCGRASHSPCFQSPRLRCGPQLPAATQKRVGAMSCVMPQNAQFCIVCLGRDTLQLPTTAAPANQTLNTVYNIVIHAPDIVAYRLKVQVRTCTPRHPSPERLSCPSSLGGMHVIPRSASADAILRLTTPAWY